MSFQGSAKAPDPRYVQRDEKNKIREKEPQSSRWMAAWNVWRQVIIAELLNFLEGRHEEATRAR